MAHGPQWQKLRQLLRVLSPGVTDEFVDDACRCHSVHNRARWESVANEKGLRSKGDLHPKHRQVESEDGQQDLTEDEFDELAAEFVIEQVRDRIFRSMWDVQQLEMRTELKRRRDEPGFDLNAAKAQGENELMAKLHEHLPRVGRHPKAPPR